MQVTDLIYKKVAKKELTMEEISFIVEGYTNNTIPDYQMSAFLMAVVLNGMSIIEISNLTTCMINSGDVIDLSSIEGIKVDKHSTGGVGDKTTLVLGPIVAACGITMAKMSGRGLGFTGGTIDKLESIPGFQVEKTSEEFVELVKKNGMAVIAQTDKIVPADKKIYSLRDVTGTVSSIPLIAASIMSKKLATGADAILLDVKVGDAAFMKNIKEAKELGRTMISIGKELGKDVRVEITSMDKPLGRAIGNRNEILEAVETLKGNGSADFIELLMSSGRTILSQAKVAEGHKAEEMIKKVIQDGTALKKFYDFIESQGGDVEAIKSPDFLKSKFTKEIFATESGFMEVTSSLALGLIAMDLGAGRKVKTDKISPTAGIYLNKKTNEKVNVGDVLFTMTSDIEISNKVVEEMQKTFRINKTEVENPIVMGRME